MATTKRNRWTELCRSVQNDDGLPTRNVGLWTEDKLWFWNRYVEIATTAMVGHPAWPQGLIYVDLFAGPGVCTIRDSNRRIPGSVLIAANSPKPFRQIIACELDDDLASACEKRIEMSPYTGNFCVVKGDCNERIYDIVRLIPEGALTLAFIDPPGLHAHFETLRILAGKGRVDLLILFADAVDALRNVAAFEEQNDSRLDLVLGDDSRWRERREEMNKCSADAFRRLLAKIYREQLQRLDYRLFGEKIMRSPKGPLYRLVFASKHERGLEFWEKVTKKDRGGQRDLF